ncbi:MAG: hypothetical protein GY723_13850 [bacterium]|nr:hypothetical protein [bacterium]
MSEAPDRSHTDPLRSHRPYRAAFVAGLALCASTAFAGELEIEWRAPAEPVQAFVIERRQGLDSNYVLVARVGPETRQFIDDAVAEGFPACYRIRAILLDGSWAPSEERCATAVAATDPRQSVPPALPPVSASPPDAPPGQ